MKSTYKAHYSEVGTSYLSLSNLDSLYLPPTDIYNADYSDLMGWLQARKPYLDRLKVA